MPGMQDDRKGPESPTHQLVPNYSEIEAVNRVYNSLGKEGADRVEALLEQGVTHDSIVRMFDSCQRGEPKKDSVTQTRALATALDYLEHNLAEKKKPNDTL